jgi:hypothetical protein
MPIFTYAECRKLALHAECRYVECLYAERRGANFNRAFITLVPRVLFPVSAGIVPILINNFIRIYNNLTKYIIIIYSG